jgi:hypothetical protein
MFQSLVKLLTVTAFVAHGLLGCCWHHAHVHVASAEAPKLERGHCQGHDHRVALEAIGERTTATDDHERRDSGSPHDSPCDEGDCVFVRIQDGVRCVTDATPALMPCLVPASLVNVKGQADSDSQGTTALRETPLRSAPPRALWQVWLI